MDHERYAARTNSVRARRRDDLIAGLRAAMSAHPPAGVREVRLFGSWARGDFDGLSDIDLLVVTDNEGVTLDVLTLPDAERIDVVNVPHDRLARYLAERHSFHTRAMREGVVVFPAVPGQ
ncbi:nucleotidyltransferase domain-containing protein [Skermanella mucosa]|uniref:nucleotidyltransferase domain-containing protein n=1 Tax=Skermanella mucosa TaxID=1789672 RepID=UPI00192B8729|nr:nucleotidyltransferase domain-containing protein [Skermanella mucosa]UEM19586.1 nucleotidyltransferase domain-containing protein [Skermanella mucosa]